MFKDGSHLVNADRMPVILGSKKAIEEWLNPDNSLPLLQSLMQPYDREDLVGLS